MTRCQALSAEVNITGNQTDVRTMTSYLLEVNLKTIKERRTGDVRPAPKLSRQHLWLQGMWISAHQSTGICQDCVSSDIYSNTTWQKISLHLLPSQQMNIPISSRLTIRGKSDAETRTEQERQTWICFLLSPCLVPHLAPICDFHSPHRSRSRLIQESSRRDDRVSARLVRPAPVSHAKRGASET